MRGLPAWPEPMTMASYFMVTIPSGPNDNRKSLSWMSQRHAMAPDMPLSRLMLGALLLRTGAPRCLANPIGSKRHQQRHNTSEENFLGPFDRGGKACRAAAAAAENRRSHHNGDRDRSYAPTSGNADQLGTNKDGRGYSQENPHRAWTDEINEDGANGT